ncbi:hypothetical protein, partial [Methylobacterium haplocladii]
MYKLSSVVVGTPIVVLLTTCGLSAEGVMGGARDVAAASDRFANGREERDQPPAERRKVDELARLLAKLQGDLIEMRADSNANSVDLSEAQANLDATKALLRQMTALAVRSR